jgi:hypothetical protein
MPAAQPVASRYTDWAISAYVTKTQPKLHTNMLERHNSKFLQQWPSYFAAKRAIFPFSRKRAGRSVLIWPGLFVCKQVTVCPGHIWTTLYLMIIKSVGEKNIMIKSALWTEFYLFLNYKSTGMNITNYVDTIFKCEVTTDIQSSLKQHYIRF